MSMRKQFHYRGLRNNVRWMLLENDHSYRFYVDGVRLIAKNLKQLLIKNGFDKNPIYDMSIYDSNKVLFLPLTTKKTDGSKSHL